MKYYYKFQCGPTTVTGFTPDCENEHTARELVQQEMVKENTRNENHHCYAAYMEPCYNETIIWPEDVSDESTDTHPIYPTTSNRTTAWILLFLIAVLGTIALISLLNWAYNKFYAA